MSNGLYYTYIMASARNGTLYIGMTNNIHRRLEEHKSAFTNSFVQRYHINMLVYVKSHELSINAIIHEKQLKKKLRNDKIALIEKSNPYWRDLSNEVGLM